MSESVSAIGQELHLLFDRTHTPANVAFEIGVLFSRVKDAAEESLRDRFATHAPPMPDYLVRDAGGEPDQYQIAEWRWNFADAMLAARATKEGEEDG